MSRNHEWAAGEVGRWLGNDEGLYRRCVSRARYSRSKIDLTRRIRSLVNWLYKDGARFGEVTLTDMRSLRLAEWDEIAEQFAQDAPWGKEDAA
jgi:hypothetical protein